MNKFEQYYGKSDAELTDDMKDLTLKRVKRGFGSTIDQLEGEKINLEKRIVDCRVRVANGTNEFIIELGQALVEMDDLEALIKVLETEQKEFVGTTK